jgi:hypothetical protein
VALGRLKAFALVVTMLPLILLAGCVHDGPRQGSQATGAPTMRSTESADATQQAQAALEEFFSAWRAHDVSRCRSLVTTERPFTEFDDDRVEFGVITPTSWDADSLPSGYDLRATRANPRLEYRVFSASVRFWGSATTLDGESLPWHWFLVRGSDGAWRVFDWGAG